MVEFNTLFGHLSHERATIHPGADTEEDEVLRHRRHRNHLAAHDHRREIHKVLTGLHVKFFDLGNFGRQEPMPVTVVAELWWNFKRDISGVAPILFYFLQTPTPEIRIDGTFAGLFGVVVGKGLTFWRTKVNECQCASRYHAVATMNIKIRCATRFIFSEQRSEENSNSNTTKK